MRPRSAAAEAQADPLPFPDDASTRDARYAELASLLDAWMNDAHEGEPDWDLEDIERTRVAVPSGSP